MHKKIISRVCAHEVNGNITLVIAVARGSGLLENRHGGTFGSYGRGSGVSSGNAKTDNTVFLRTKIPDSRLVIGSRRCARHIGGHRSLRIPCPWRDSEPITASGLGGRSGLRERPFNQTGMSGAWRLAILIVPLWS